MKYRSLIPTIICFVARFAVAQDLKPLRIESDLGDALGFQVYRFETQLANDEVLVIREHFQDRDKILDSEFGIVGSGSKANYQITLVDSGMFHPSLRGSYMLRYPTSDGVVEKVRLAGSGTGPNSVEFRFVEVSDPTSNRTLYKYQWTSKIEKYKEVVKRWPDLPAPTKSGTSGSRHAVGKTAPSP
jgi:hypothetical protein